ncbi:Ig family protein [Dickeya chrysanthemi Ech1591]|uniref:Ig family protein n=1 Tax=Dickeya chrysanthemi (strain Ech1591) TaxID=561229 RepID=C6CHJ7_DICC1|nr:putative Ig domain-containing protein [Dickeya chrysanthemi]ACT06898.1 Ig family protein [Dickeya chrysanthemi Ech1591]
MQKSFPRPAWSQTLALEPRMMFDAAAGATAIEVANAQLNAAAPDATATPVSGAVYAIDKNGGLGADVPLFSNADVSTDNAGNEITRLVITVGTTGSNQALMIDGTAIALTTTSETQETRTSHYTYNVDVADGNTTITLFLANGDTAVTPDAVETLINGINYRALDSNVANGEVTVTLKSITDIDGDSSDVDISARLQVENNKNLAPTLDHTADLALRDDLTVAALADSGAAVGYSRDGRFAYVAGSNGTLLVYAVSDSGGLSKVQSLSGFITTDTQDENGGEAAGVNGISVGDNAVYLLNGGAVITLGRADDGAVSLMRRDDIGDTAVDTRLSADGKNLYISARFGIHIYAIGGDGTLTLTDIFRENADRSAGIAVAGDYLFTMIPNGDFQSISVLRRTTVDGVTTLALVDNTTVASDWNFTAPFRLAASRDGSQVYSLNTEDGTLITWRFDGAKLTQIDSRIVASAEAIAISADNRQLFVSTRDGTLYRYHIGRDGALAPLASQNTGGGQALGVSGTSLLVVGGNSIERYSSQLNYTVGGSGVPVASTLTLRDSNADALNGGLGNYVGSSITLTADNGSNNQFTFQAANGLSVSGNQLLLNDTVIGGFVTNGNRVTLTFTADVSTATANQALHQILWASTGVSSARVTLTVVVNDGELNSQPQTVAVRVNQGPVRNDGVAGSYTLPVATSETVYRVTLPALFNDANGDNLNWSVTGLPDGLRFDPETRTLSGSTTVTGTRTLTITVTDTSGASASTTLELTVNQIDNRAPLVSESAPAALTPAVINETYSLTLDAGMFHDADGIYGDNLRWQVSGLPAGLRFDADTLTISGTATALSNDAVTITVTDASNATTTLSVTLRVITADEAANRAPVLQPDASSLSYTSQGGLIGYSYYVDNIALSADGGMLAVVGGTGPNYTGTIYVNLYSRDSRSGELTLLTSYTQGASNDGNDNNGIEIDGLRGMTAVAFSADGNTLYLSGSNSQDNAVLQAFSIGADGALTLTDSELVSAPVVKVALAGDGNSVYAMTANGLYRYSRDAQGMLTAQESFSGLNNAQSISVDQNQVYVLGGSGNLSVYAAGGNGVLSAQGTLSRSGTALSWTDSNGNRTEVGTLPASGGLNAGIVISMAVSDGYIYVVTGNSNHLTVLHYDAGSNRVSLVSSRNISSEIGNLFPMSATLSADGSALYVGSNSGRFAVYQVGEQGNLTLRSSLNGAGAMLVVAASADGKSIYGGSRYYSTGLRLFSGDAELVQADWTEGGSTRLASQIVLSDVDYDRLNNGVGNYNGASIIIAREGSASADDVYGLMEGNGLTLNNGVMALNGTAIATLTQTDGRLTVTFTADVTRAVANLVLHQLTWQSTSHAPPASLNMVVSFRDQYVTTDQLVTVNVTPVNDAPTLNSQSANPIWRDNTTTVNVFSNTVIDTVEPGQNILGLTLTVSGLVSGENDYLVIDGKTVALADGVRVITNNSLVISVSVTDGVATVSISSLNGMTTAAAQTLVDGIAYGNSDAHSGTRQVTLTQVRDSGGTAQGGHDGSTLDIRATITLQAENMPPRLTAPDNHLLEQADSLSAVSGLGAITHSMLSADGTTLYVTDGSGMIALFSRDSATGKLSWVSNIATGLGAIGSITLTGDGLMMLVAGGDTLSVFSRTGDGQLTLQGSYDVWGVSAVQVSADGATVYALDSSFGIKVFSRDVARGTLNALQEIGYDAWEEPRLFSPVALTAKGDYLYVITDPVSGQFPNSLIVYQRQSDGTLAFVSVLHDGEADASGAIMDLGAPTRITVSDDGSQIYVVNGGNLNIYAFNHTTGKLLHVDTLANIGAVNALTLSQAQDQLYVLRNDGSVQVYRISSAGVLSLTSTYRSADYAALSGATAVQTTRDGALLVSGSQIISFIPASDELRYTVGSGADLAFTGGLVLSDKGLDVLNNGLGNYGGAGITVKDSSGLGRFALRADSRLTFGDDGQLRDNGVVVGRFTQQGGVLSITFADGVTTATANNLLASLTYSNTNLSTANPVTLSVSADDGQLTSGDWQRSLTINHAPQVSDGALQPIIATVGAPVNLTLPAGLFSDADGDNLNWAISGLPAGYRFDAATRTLSGVAGTAGLYTLTITVTDGDSASASRTLSLRVNSAPQAGEGDTTFTLTVGEPVNITLADSLFIDAEGDALNWRVTGLPDGLRFDTDSHTLSGNLAVGRYSLVMTATDIWGAGTSRQLVLNITPPPTDGSVGGDSNTNSNTNNGPDPVILPPTVAFSAQESRDDERFLPAEASPSRPDAIPGVSGAPADTPDAVAYNTVAATGGALLASGALNYQETPWALAPVMTNLMPPLEPLNVAVRSADGERLTRTTAWSGVWQDNGDGRLVFRLPQGLQTGVGFVAAQLANGRPLPTWIQFDARQGELRTSSTDAARSGQIQLRLQRADGAPALVLTLRDGRLLTTAEVNGATAETTATAITESATERAVATGDAAAVTPRATPADAPAFHQGLSHSLVALRGDSDDLLQALTALARD